MLKPTLGGLKKLQQFMGKNGYPMPVFQTDIFQDGMVKGKFLLDGGEKVSIDEEIRKQGAGFKIINVRLTDEKGKRFIQFIDPILYSNYIFLPIYFRRINADLQFSEGKTEDEKSFTDFLNAQHDAIFEIAFWGKENPSVMDKFLSCVSLSYY
jgi:hypothetical protein